MSLQLQDLPRLLARLRLSQARPQLATFKQLHDSINQLMAMQATIAALAPRAAAAAEASAAGATSGAAAAAAAPGSAYRTPGAQTFASPQQVGSTARHFRTTMLPASPLGPSCWGCVVCACWKQHLSDRAMSAIKSIHLSCLRSVQRWQVTQSINKLWLDAVLSSYVRVHVSFYDTVATHRAGSQVGSLMMQMQRRLQALLTSSSKEVTSMAPCMAVRVPTAQLHMAHTAHLQVQAQAAAPFTLLVLLVQLLPKCSLKQDPGMGYESFTSC